METKYQIGDIISAEVRNGKNYYLVEDIRDDKYVKVTYSLRRLEDDQIISSYASTVDSNIYITKEA